MSHKVLGEVLTVKQFLRLPETKPPLEFVDGRVVQKVSPKTTHNVLQGALWTYMRNFARASRLGQVILTQRCTFGGQSVVPDIAFFAEGRIARTPSGKLVEDVFVAPDLAIEILSRGQTVKELSNKLKQSVRKGVKLAWLIQPSRELMHVFRPDAGVLTLERGDTLTADEVLPGFALSVAEMFDWLKQE